VQVKPAKRSHSAPVLKWDISIRLSESSDTRSPWIRSMPAIQMKLSMALKMDALSNSHADSNSGQGMNAPAHISIDRQRAAGHHSNTPITTTDQETGLNQQPQLQTGNDGTIPAVLLDRYRVIFLKRTSHLGYSGGCLDRMDVPAET
jgi:hypothetical protein